MYCTAVSSAAAAGPLMEPPAAALCVELCDVEDTTIIAIWKHIYSYLGTDGILSGMLVCKSFCKELPALVRLLQ